MNIAKRQQREVKVQALGFTKAGTVRKRAPGAGRKPAGEGVELVREYPTVMLRLPVATLAQLKALAAVRSVPVWRTIDAAVLAYVEALTGAEADDVRRLAKREAGRLKAKYPSR